MTPLELPDGGSPALFWTQDLGQVKPRCVKIFLSFWLTTVTPKKTSNKTPVNHKLETKVNKIHQLCPKKVKHLDRLNQFSDG